MFHQLRQTRRHGLALTLRRLKYGAPKTKVFCVGFQKTGTTSLQYALSKLGYRVAGVLSTEGMRSRADLDHEVHALLSRFDAFADNPWPLYFREFDVMFPDAKFILTARDPEAWYGSVCKHFGTDESQLRSWIYGAGSPIGNKGAYIDRLIEHQEAVRDHFADRPDDFLEFDVTAGQGWETLCDFLGKPCPRGNFPRLNTAEMRK